MLKAHLRNQFLLKRQQLTKTNRLALQHKLQEHFLAWLPKEIFTIHIYIPIEAKNEIDTWPIIRSCWEKDLNTLVPAIDLTSRSITSRVLTPETKLQKNIWGISEPLGADFADTNVIDLVVLPLLAYDKKGYRVGYGKGFYDKFLASFINPPLKVGLSYFEPVSEILDIHPHDIPLDICITPETIYKFRS